MNWLKFLGPVSQGVYRLGKAIRTRRLRKGKRVIFKRLGRQSLDEPTNDELAGKAIDHIEDGADVIRDKEWEELLKLLDEAKDEVYPELNRKRDN